MELAINCYHGSHFDGRKGDAIIGPLTTTLPGKRKSQVRNRPTSGGGLSARSQ